MLEKNGEIEVIKEGVAFCYFEGNKVYYEIRSEIGTNGNITNEILNFGSVDVNGNNDFILVNLSVKDWYGDDYDFDYPIRIPITIDCVQIIFNMVDMMEVHIFIKVEKLQKSKKMEQVLRI